MSLWFWLPYSHPSLRNSRKILSFFSANYMKDFVYLLYLHLLRICFLLFPFCSLVWKKIGLFLMLLTHRISFRWDFDSPPALQTNPWLYIAGWEVLTVFFKWQARYLTTGLHTYSNRRVAPSYRGQLYTYILKAGWSFCFMRGKGGVRRVPLLFHLQRGGRVPRDKGGSTTDSISESTRF